MATIKDVALKANVSVVTVSRVLNNRGYISEKTRDKVYKAMEELDYHPNEMARFLSKKQTNYIGIILPSVEHPYFAKVLHWMEYYATLAGYQLLVSISDNDAGKTLESIYRLYANRVAGMVLCSRSGEIPKDFNCNCPVISFERRLSEQIPSVECDNYQGGVLAAETLISRGCKKLAVLAGSQKLVLPAQQRVFGFIQTCKDHNINGLIVQTEEQNFRNRDYTSLIKSALEKNPDIDGIFATSDVMAAETIRVCDVMHKKVPDDIKIVGFDDVYISTLTSPSITTIHQPVEAMCKYAIDNIKKMMYEEVAPSRVVLPVTLIKRESA